MTKLVRAPRSEAPGLDVARVTLKSLQDTMESLKALHPELKQLKPMPSVREMIKQLGGIMEVGRKLGVTNQTVNTYQVRGFFPPESYFILKPEIEALGYEADPKAFRMRTRD